MCIAKPMMAVAIGKLRFVMRSVQPCGLSLRLYGYRDRFRTSVALYIVLLSTLSHANEFPVIEGFDTSRVVDKGVELSAAQLANLPVHVFSDGTGLPDGSGTAAQGAPLYAQHCAHCHGSQGQGGKALELVGDRALLASDYPDKGIGVYWPYAPTLFEYINRSMPPATPGMFSIDELYSLIAHILVLNGLLESGFVLDRQSISELQLPNRDGFTTIAR